jgi:Zn-dependent M28 family amino/carboxypeptidase
MRLVFGGPVLVALGARRLGGVLAAGSALAFLDIGLRKVVPGANDNLSGVAAMLGVARALAADPVRGVRVLLVSTGSEESFEEGMLGFARTHAAELDPARTRIIAIDTVGSPRLVLVEGEGMLAPDPYDAALKDVLAASAEEQGIPIIREHWLSFGSDALVGLRRGIPSALVASFDEFKLPANYHKPTDTPDNVVYDTVADAATVIEGAVRRLARS